MQLIIEHRVSGLAWIAPSLSLKVLFRTVIVGSGAQKPPPPEK